MSLKDELIAYKARWAEVDAVISEERRNASMELRWRQFNSAFCLSRGLGINGEDSSEIKVFERWARIKEKAEQQIPKT
jgi:hypothetical protein